MVTLVRELTATEDPAEVQRLTLAFTTLIVQAAHSPRIPVVLRAMSAMVPGRFFETVPEAIPNEKRGLAAVVRAAKKGDGEKAAAEYAKMFAQHAEVVVELFRQRNLVGRSQPA
jgi:DNA-binding GntR family transcriptional regulator